VDRQFGRVLVEALWCGVPVIGSQSGEIPWVITATGGGALYPEGDVDALADLLRRLGADSDKRGEARRGGSCGCREAVQCGRGQRCA
jgi:glycosyltransferase involved in cell wall biosynthesis